MIKLTYRALVFASLFSTVAGKLSELSMESLGPIPDSELLVLNICLWHGLVLKMSASSSSTVTTRFLWRPYVRNLLSWPIACSTYNIKFMIRQNIKLHIHTNLDQVLFYKSQSKTKYSLLSIYYYIYYKSINEKY